MKARTRKRERENESGWARESQTNKCRSRTLAFGIARPVSETRRFNQRAKKSRVAEKRQSEGERKTEGERKRGRRERGEEGKKGGSRPHPKICGPTGNTRTLLVTSR